MTTATSEQDIARGLEGVLACTTSICSIDGERGELRYRGHEIRELVDARVEFADVAQLLWLGRWPAPAEQDRFDALERSRRQLPPPVLAMLESTTTGAHPLAVVRTAVSMEGALDGGIDDDAPDLHDRALTLYARSATLVGALASRVTGTEPRAPRTDLSHAANMLWMATGREPQALEVEAANALLVTYAEHELNASTFTARTVIGTKSDYWSAITAAIGALKGPLHGGAVDDAIRLFLAVGDPHAVDRYLDEAIDRKVKVPGFGHRVYRTRDPRAIGMEGYAERLSELDGDDRLLRIARALEHGLAERKGLRANVDYYGALVMHLLGFPLQVFSSVIVASRCAGWTAHIVEQAADNRLIRPRARYVGPPPATVPR